jgi:hypothetical protein
MEVFMFTLKQTRCNMRKNMPPIATAMFLFGMLLTVPPLLTAQERSEAVYSADITPVNQFISGSAATGKRVSYTVMR